MFRITHYMKEVLNPTPFAPRGKLPGPVVIWNLIRRCNLKCKHCYSISSDVDFPGELTTDEVFRTMDDLWEFGVRVLILSGGEPLLRPDIFEISQRAKNMGFYVGLSTNGALIDDQMIAPIAEIDYDYVGISLDGIGATHDAFRGKDGAFDASLYGAKLCRKRGLKVGLRFTMTMDNAHQLPDLLKLIEDEDINKFYLSHLNYAGRGNKNRGDDAHWQITRDGMNLMFETCLRLLRDGNEKEFVTGNNDADGVYLLLWLREHFPDKADAIQAKLEQWGGNSSGVNIANIDNLGDVHPDTFWWNYKLGNVKERPFSEIWPDTSDPIMAGLKQFPRKVGGRCGQCQHFSICGGNTRVRAMQITGDPWAEDPGCYLTDEEIGVSPGQTRLVNRPFAKGDYANAQL